MSIFREPCQKTKLQLLMVALVTGVALLLFAGLFVWSPFLAQCFCACLVLALGYAYVIEPRWVEYREVPLIVPGLPREFVGWKVALVSDLHCGPHFCREAFRQAVQRINSADVDLVLIAGDFFSVAPAPDLSPNRVVPAEGQRAAQAPVGRCRPESCGVGLVAGLRARQGVYAVLGNHEAFSGTEPFVEYLRELPGQLRLLRNEAAVLRSGGARMVILGVEDGFEAVPDAEVEARVRSLWPQGEAGDPSECAVLLYHRPDAVEVSARLGVNLQFSGHTHGGQVRIPGVGAVFCFSRFGKRYDCGLFQVGPTALYVSRGFGMALLPFRFCCRPEVTFFTLQRG